MIFRFLKLVFEFGELGIGKLSRKGVKKEILLGFIFEVCDSEGVFNKMSRLPNSLTIT